MMIDQFLNYLRYERRASALTVQTYEVPLREFESYVSLRDTGLSLQSADADLIRDWMESLMDKGNTASTIGKKLSALRSFYLFALKRGLVDRDPAHGVTGPKKSKPLPQFLRESEMDRLLDQLEWNTDDFEDARARTILVLFYEAGLRRSELAGLDDKDVDFSLGQLKVTGKRNKQRIIPFGQELADTLRNYMAVRNSKFPTVSGPLFLGDKGQRITAAKVYTIVRKYLSMVTSLKKRSPHVLRHSFATAMLNNGASLESIKKLLGHESINTTEIYAHTTFEQLKRIYKEAHPRA